MRLDYNSADSLSPVIEALLFAGDEPLSAQSLRMLILGEEISKTSVEEEVAVATEASETPEAIPAEPNTDETVDDSPENIAENGASVKKPRKKRKSPIELSLIYECIEKLNQEYEATGRSFRIIEIAGGYQFATRSEHAEYVARLFKEKSRRRLSGAALETLAIISYKQPVSKLDVENIRGVNCDEVLKSLLEKNLITITGRAEAVGRPLLYGTTGDFLRHFGLPSIQDLPKPRELEELMKEESIRATTLEEAASEFSPQSDTQNAPDDALIIDLTSDAPITSDADLTGAPMHVEFGSIELDIESAENMPIEEFNDPEIPGDTEPEAIEALDYSDENSEEITH
jgi:segregation and condensation protein B